jgi:hypothetical protein
MVGDPGIPTQNFGVASYTFRVDLVIEPVE